MAHELTKRADGSHEFMYAGEKPWHGLGTPVNTLQKAQDAIQHAKLDWSVSKRALITCDGFSVPENIGMAVTRDDNNLPLGIVTDSYELIQNHEAFSFFDAVVGTGEAIYETAGSIFGGKRVFITAQIPGTIRLSGDDTIEKYLILTNPHDGSGSLRMFFTPIRVVCNNTLNAALRQASSDYTLDRNISIRHTGDVQAKISQAQNALGLANSYYKSFEEICQSLRSKLVDSAMVNTFLRECFELKPTDEISTRTANSMDRVEALFSSDPKNNLAGMKGTAWALYNAAAQYADHEAIAVKQFNDRRMNSILWGSGESFKDRALNSCLELVKA